MSRAIRPFLLAAGFAVATSCLGVAGAVAQGIDLSHGGPISITARNGIEWLQQQHQVIATGDARAVRQNVTVTADRLVAFYRKKTDTAGKGAPPASAKTAAAKGPLDLTGADEGGNEIYRLEAQGHVVISTPTDRAQGDRAVYDLDKAVLVMTGRNLRLTTPNDVLTARDDLEYWSAKHMAVARGDAVVVTKDRRRISADVLVAYTSPQEPQQASEKPAGSDDLMGASGKLTKVEAFGHVVISTPTDVVTGGRGVYVPETGIALLVDHVRITRGRNQLEGSEAEVNLKTGVSRLLAARPGHGSSGRVAGLLVPNEAQPAAEPPGAQAATGGAKR